MRTLTSSLIFGALRLLLCYPDHEKDQTHQSDPREPRPLRAVFGTTVRVVLRHPLGLCKPW